MADNRTDYMYGSARIRALENSIIGREGCERMADARGIGEIISMLGEQSVSAVYGQDDDFGSNPAQSNINQKPDFEATLLQILRGAYDVIRASSPNPGTFDFLRYPYDCNNIKAALKCGPRGIEYGDMLFDIGTITPEAVRRMESDRNFDALPARMRKAAPEAVRAFGQTGDPRKIDAVIDRACWLDMAEGALRTGEPEVARLICARIDIINLMICIRVLRMGGALTGISTLSEFLLEGGEVATGFFEDSFDGGEVKLYENLRYTHLSELAADLESEGVPPLSSAERICDDYWMQLVRDAGRFIPFGAAVLFGYASAREYEVKNIRIIIAGKLAGLPPDTIRSRIRLSYV